MGICASMKKPSETHRVPYGQELPKDDNNFFDNIPNSYNKMSKTPSSYLINKPGNPGTWEELHKKVYDLYPKNFDGLQIVKKRKLSEHFNVSHTFVMSGTTPTGYRFGASYDGIKRIGPNERYPSLRGDIMPNGNLTASFVHTFGCRCRFKVNTQIDQYVYKIVNYNLDYRTDDLTVSTKLVNIDPLKWHGLFSLQLLQAVSPRIAIGAEVSCWKDLNYPKGNQTNMCGGIRYSTGRQTISAILGEDGLHVSYHHIASRELQLGVEVKTNLRTHKSEAKIVYQFDLPKMDTVFRGIINSETSIGAIIEKKLLPVPGATLLLSAFLNHKHQRLHVGIGLNIE